LAPSWWAHSRQDQNGNGASTLLKIRVVSEILGVPSALADDERPIAQSVLTLTPPKSWAPELFRLGSSQLCPTQSMAPRASLLSTLRRRLRPWAASLLFQTPRRVSCGAGRQALDQRGAKLIHRLVHRAFGPPDSQGRF
jgi:hypothetical protein